MRKTNGSYKLLKDGAYTYTATTTEEGYEDAAGSVDPTAGTLTIDLPKVDSLTVDTTNAKTTYFQNEKLKTDGLVLTVHYTNADDKEISAADFAAKGVTAAFDSIKRGNGRCIAFLQGQERFLSGRDSGTARRVPAASSVRDDHLRPQLELYRQR